ncbi:MAG: ATP-binding protein [Planctomycetota bacterium]
MRLRWKLTAGFGILVVLTTASVGALLAQWFEQESLRRIQRTLLSEAYLYRASVVDPRPAAELQARTHALGEQIRSRLTLIDPQGAVLCDSEEAPERMDNHAARPEFKEALAGRVGSSTRYSRTVGTRMMYLALPLEREGRVVGAVRVSLPLAEIDARRAQIRQMVISVAGLGLLIALLPGLLLARRFTEPLGRITEGARAIAEGEIGPRLSVETGDELGELASAFNTMREQLAERLRTITNDRNQTLAILASMNEGVIAVDSQEKIVHLNRVAARVLGVPHRLALGMSLAKLEPAADLLSAVRRTLERPKTRVRELLRDREGSPQTWELRTTPIRDTDGKILGALVVLHDLTELRRLEGMRRDFVANVSHELKTPLTAIQLLVENLQDDPDMPLEHRARFHEKIRAQAARLTTLVADLLALSRIEAHEGTLVRDPLDLHLPLEESVRAQRTTAEERGVSLITEFPDSPVMVDGDAESLRQITDNLISNAVTHTPEGGRITVRLFCPNAREVWLEVADTGLGIEPEFRERIFERFFRVDKARSRARGGTGLGLSIVKHLTLAHEGEVSVESELGKGSTFRVRLPRSGAPPISPAVSARHPAASGD